jgi:Na+-driven multidrug efflux pump
VAGRFENWRRIIRPAIVVTALAVAVCLASSAYACPTCKEDMANSAQARGLATGFYYSILLMVTAPFAMIGMLGFVAYRSVKRAQAEQAERDAQASALQS